MLTRRRVLMVTAAIGAVILTACGSGSAPVASSPSSSLSSASSSGAAHSHGAGESLPLRTGESFLEVGLAQKYTPHADKGTDDYRCFLVDPQLTKDVFLTGVTFEPDQAAEVHHAILYRVDPAQVASAKAEDAQSAEQGWSCFGGAGMSVSVTGTGNAAADAVAQLESAPWLSAWAPGGKEQLYNNNVGVPMKAGSAIVLQVHYNLRAGTSADQTKVRLRVAPSSAGLNPLSTMLLPAPVELPCAPGQTGTLCDRTASVLDVMSRFGTGAGSTVAGLQLLCGGSLTNPVAGNTQHCDRKINSAVTIQAAAGHMHLLGKSISIVLDPGTDHEKTILDIPVWNFDDQGARQLPSPISVSAGHTIRVTCTHDASLRTKLPALQDLPQRYVTWGDGTADEMCLGVLLVTQG